MEFHMADPSKLPFPKAPRSDISVNIGGGKGVLIAPHWVLTASHCISSSKDGVTRMTYTNAKGNNVSIMTDKVIRCETQDLALARLSRAAEGRSPLLLVKDGFPVSSKHSQPFLLKKVAGNGVWSEIPAASPKNPRARDFTSPRTNAMARQEPAAARGSFIHPNSAMCWLASHTAAAGCHRWAVSAIGSNARFPP
jgi:hypothetical protein